jgi:hypothetical protein
MERIRHEPPRFISLDDYGASLNDIDVWTPSVRTVLERHGLEPERQLRMGTAGTFPTVLADTSYVVKFFGPLFGGYECAENERALYPMLAADPAIPAPKMIASGRLGPNDGCRWDYIVSSQLAGESYDSVREQLDEALDHRSKTRRVASISRTETADGISFA